MSSRVRRAKHSSLLCRLLCEQVSTLGSEWVTNNWTTASIRIDYARSRQRVHRARCCIYAFDINSNACT